ncbi:OLC1v1016918C1 [Oldenlandia corymbosa var. corymbosa]|uniref:OLC1v1016918C1 n=1 Tax=Oldenlandia corymbosa var. corymbosa TaxID=529605 RepID=A0AAV1E889_OLDCO|nr:OLC1v1016918C1 [Oldenlandia corymbosa var. corymbosa]
MIQRLFLAYYKAGDESDGFATVEMKPAFFELTLNIMMRMIAGKRYYCDEAQKREKAIRFRDLIQENGQLSGASNMADFIQLARWIGSQGKLEKRLRNLQMKRDKFMQDLIQERREILRNSKIIDGRTMIDVLLSLQDNEPKYYTDEMRHGSGDAISWK